jgi:hypothetical protein
MSEPLRLWSVTTLIKLGLGTSEGLVNWAVRTTAEAAVNQRAAVTAIIDDAGHDAAVDYLTRARWGQTGKAKARGTDIHKLAEQIALGAEPDVPEHLRPYVEQYRRWLDRFQPRFLMAEAPVYNVSEHYAGTLDGIMELDSRPLVFDIKTTEHGPDSGKTRPPFPEVALQLAAYSRAEYAGVLSEQRYAGGRRYYLFDPAVEHEPLPEVQGALGIVISPHDCFACAVRVDDEVWQAFLDVREAARWQTHTSRGLFGPPLAAPVTEETAA